MKNVARTEPCAREGFLYGIGTGFGVAVLRFFQRGKIFSAGNWGVATFAAVAILSKQLCHFQHAHQRAKIHTLMEMQTKTVQHKIEGFEAAEESKSE
ncbi:hypothetical protein FBU59_003552 [Linderina macrospora]|uniref:Uncharacterized protein n=1 Tax=Linderina macrospora TaxID=4868 RepID=A0ACC1J7Y6_9FUNG|nr:hypothetical protein FBU59_003552 [Linderina macrospora]